MDTETTTRQAADATDAPGAKGIRVEKTMTISKPAEELYHFWRNFENLPRIMDHVKSVQVLDERRSHWVAKAPADREVEWDAEITDEVPNQRIAWRSVGNAEVDNEGSVSFKPATGGRGTEVKVMLRYDPPAGVLGAAVAKLFGEEPSQTVKEDLRHFKQIMEAGEIPTTDGQPHGDTGVLSKFTGGEGFYQGEENG